MKMLVKALLIALIILPAAALMAQTTYEVKTGEVVSVYGDKLVYKDAAGATKEVTVPAGFTFDVDGKQLTVDQLTPGMKLTAVIKTTTKPVTVHTTKVKNGEVVKVQGSQLWVKTDGKVKAFTVPAGFKFVMDGKNVGVSDLTPGAKITAEIVYTSEKTETTKEAKISGSAPAPAPAPEAAPAAAAPAAEAAPAKMPKTASNVALLGLLGLSLLAAGVAIRRA